MKQYKFKIQTENPKILIKKTFELKLKNKIDNYDLFEKAIEYLTNNYREFFKLGYEEYIYFDLTHDKIKVFCEAEFDFCNCCGGTFEIWGGYDEENE